MSFEVCHFESKVEYKKLIVMNRESEKMNRNEEIIQILDVELDTKENNSVGEVGEY